jgi:hypothetical protein
MSLNTRKLRWILAVAAAAAIAAVLQLALSRAKPSPPDSDQPQAQSGRVAERFVGSESCRGCHERIYESYSASGMGRSLARIDLSPSNHGIDAVSFSPDGRHRYSVEKSAGRLVHREELVNAEGETVFDQSLPVEYCVGSGNQGRSYLIRRDDQFFMSPIGWYSRSDRWDLSPGYTLPRHLRFERQVTEGCLDCHTGRMNRDETHANRFRQPPFLEESIGCERCHGPGGGHIDFRKSAKRAGPDPIVNPSRLDPARREDVCNQCHLQGEARYLREGCHFGDFRPGQRLEDVMLILVQGTRATADGRTQAVSQVEQMRASACFRKSDGKFGCVSCHDPHSQPPVAGHEDHYRKKCLACHEDTGCSLPVADRAAESDSCIACHMPRLRTTDVPHTSQTDHRVIRKPMEPAAAGVPTAELEFFDSADQRLPRAIVDRTRALWMADAAETRGDPRLAAQAYRQLSILARQNSKDAEIQIALGTASQVEGRLEDAVTHWKNSLAIDPNREEPLQSTAMVLQKLGRSAAARSYFEEYLKIQPFRSSMWGRYSHLLGQLGEIDLAIDAGKRALELDPSQERINQWLAELSGRKGNAAERARYLRQSESIRAASPKP